MPKLFTKNGYDFFVVSSLLQKSLRRGDLELAARASHELLPKYSNYVWNRLLVISAEDCASLVTGEVMACYLGWCKVNDDRSRAQRVAETEEDVPPWNMRKGSRVFFLKALVLLAKCKHSRDADELGHLVIDRMSESVFQAALDQAEAAMTDEDLEFPEYTFDMHTGRGKSRGAGREGFLRTEHEAMRADNASVLVNFDQLIEGWGVRPEFVWDEDQ